jgi:hypothetical protein
VRNSGEARVIDGSKVGFRAIVSLIDAPIGKLRGVRFAVTNKGHLNQMVSRQTWDTLCKAAMLALLTIVIALDAALASIVSGR